MGHDINKLVEVDVRKVAKRLVSAEAPCSAELGKFMDCMKVGALQDAAFSKQTPVSAVKPHADSSYLHGAWCNWVLRMRRGIPKTLSRCALRSGLHWWRALGARPGERGTWAQRSAAWHASCRWGPPWGNRHVQPTRGQPLDAPH